MKLTVVGGGYVGLTAAACFAAVDGIQVSCFEINCQKVDQLQAGICPIKEPSLEKLLRHGLETGNLLFTSHADEAISGADMFILAVGTPAAPDGSPDLSALQQAVNMIGSGLRQDAIIIIKSTIPPGGTMLVEHWITSRTNHSGIHANVVYAPEFLREGSAVFDFLAPQRIVMGGNNPTAMRQVAQMYQMCHRKQIPILYTTPRNAELIKYASNSFLALRVAFINELAELCSASGGEIGDVAYGMGLDSRIGLEYFTAGIGFGGGCLPKDLQGLTRFAQDMHSPLPILEQVIHSNAAHQEWLSRLIRSKVQDGTTIGVWGLTFKAGTDDQRQSPALSLIQTLTNIGGYAFRLYDANVHADQIKQLDGVEYVCVETPWEALFGVQSLLIMVACEEFKSIPIDILEREMQGRPIFDLCRLYPDRLHRPRLSSYWCLGEGWKNG